jgi:hypothetical protein
VTRADTILRQFLLRDFTVVKVMVTAIVVGGLGVYAMLQLGLIEKLHVKNAAIYGTLLGGAIFGSGMALLGYCPGTGVAAIGDGSRDAIAGVLGGLLGAAVFAEVHPWFGTHVLRPLDLGKKTLPDVTGLSPWLYVLGTAAVATVLFVLVELRERHRARRPGTA